MKKIIGIVFFPFLITGFVFGHQQEVDHHSMNMQEIEIFYEPPTAEEFVVLRAIAGMKPRTIASAEK